MYEITNIATYFPYTQTTLIAVDPREENAGASSGRWFLSSKSI